MSKEVKYPLGKPEHLKFLKKKYVKLQYVDGAYIDSKFNFYTVKEGIAYPLK